MRERVSRALRVAIDGLVWGGVAVVVLAPRPSTAWWATLLATSCLVVLRIGDVIVRAAQPEGPGDARGR